MSDPSESVTCPICGKQAESGAVYSRSSALQWIAGKPDWKKRLKAALFLSPYEIVGEIGILTASHAPGILCRSCGRVILEFTSRQFKDYFPDVKK